MAKKTNTAEMVEDKELQIVKQNTNKAMSAAQALTITTDEDLNGATELLTKINLAGDMIKKRKEEITKPLNEALKSARELFRPLEDAQQNAKQIVAQKMVDYKRAQDEARRKEQERLAARVEKGTMKPETAMRKMEELPDAPKSVKTEAGAVSFKEVPVAIITDETQIPRTYLVPDMVKINKAIRAGIEIPGIKVEMRTDIANRRN